jgi:CubicO group peptidase (beta-lactamase class C family)
MRESVVALAASHPLAYEPGAQSIYSDLGFILLGAWLEKVFGDRLDRLADRIWYSPLGLKSLRFPGGSPFPLDAVVAPTEDCPARRVMVRGEVHDLNARAMGGIAGHAGLFGAAVDVLGMALELCAAFHGRGGDLVKAATVRAFFSPQEVPGSTWRLGFDGPSARGSLAGDRFARSAVGHLAFTGCSFWMDPATETCVVFLCNRVHPAVRDDPRFRTLRREVNDTALAVIGYGAS